MRHGSLFSGIGGFDLASKWMGWENVFQVEKDSFCQKVLEKNFPNTKRYGCIKEFNGLEYAGRIDVLSGGFPCQSFSLAGKGAVDLTLWKEMFRVVGEIRPKVVVAENVFGILARKKGMALSTVYDDLESAGYQTVPPLIIPACAVNAPHRRDRVWIVAYSNRDRQPVESINEAEGRGKLGLVTNPVYSGSQNRWPEGAELLPRECKERSLNSIDTSKAEESNSIPGWAKFPTQSLVCRRDDGIPFRVEQISGFGNAIVPQVAYEIFKAINHVNKVI